MARPKGFEQDKVLEKAVGLFRQKGYEAASIQEMVSATGLNCSSLYNTFGDKHRLFLAALEFYIHRKRESLLQTLSQPAPRLQVVRTWLETTADGIASGLEPSCFVVDAATELAERDEEVAHIIRAQFAWNEETFRQVFAEAQRNGEISKTHDPHALARFLWSVLQGLLVTGTTNRDRKALQDIIDTAMLALT